MEILFVLLPLSIVLVLIALRVFSWAIRSGQFDDLDRESLRILMDKRGDAADVREPVGSGSPGASPESADARSSGYARDGARRSTETRTDADRTDDRQAASEPAR